MNLNDLPIPVWIQIIGFSVLGAMALMGAVDLARTQRRKLEREAVKDTVALMGTKVDLVEEAHQKMEVALEDTRLKFIKVETENNMLKEIFQGRDTGSVERGKQVLMIVESIHLGVSGLITSSEYTNKSIVELTRAIREDKKLSL